MFLTTSLLNTMVTTVHWHKNHEFVLCSFHSLTLRVDTELHRAEDIPMSATIQLGGGTAYLGGLPLDSGITLNEDLPVQTSFIGGFHNIRINSE